jgi:hypothetical protein
MNGSEPIANHPRRKRADLASVVGAALLGGGLGAIFARYLDLSRSAVALVAVGIVMHAWGMLERHRLDTAAPRVWWAEVLYWACWLAILAIIVGIVLIRA